MKISGTPSYRMIAKQESIFARISKDYKRNKFIILMAIPVVTWYIIFCYLPMFGIVIAFQDYRVAKGIFDSDWVGLKNFELFLNGFYIKRIIKNTLLINIYQLLYGFPAPILLALLLNEVRNRYFRKTIQTVSYLPHFVSEVIICGMIVNFCSPNGLINRIIDLFGHGEAINLLSYSQYYRTIYVASGIWQGIGWGSIIYLAALAGVDPQQYDAANIDGANRFQQMLHITVPGIMPTVAMMFILRIGGLMSEGAGKSILIYNPSTYEVSDIISTYVYRMGILDANYSFSAAVGLFSSVINLLLLILANTVSRKISENSLW